MSRRSTPREDTDIPSVGVALRRAARRAHELGERTGTPVYVLRDGKIVDLTRENAHQEQTNKEQHRRSSS